MDFKKYTQTIDTDKPAPQFDIPLEETPVIIETTESGEELPVKRGRGRPKGSKNRPKDGSVPNRIAYGTQRDHKEVSKRFANILTGTTGMASIIRPHFEMTEDEASNISDPLAAYAIRQEQFSPQIREFLDKYDIIAAGIAFMAYLIRVWKDDGIYRENRDAGQRANATEPNVVPFAREEKVRGRESSVDAQRYQNDGGFTGISTPNPPGGL